MAIKWYKKATVQVAIVTGLFAFLATICATLITKEWDVNEKDNVSNYKFKKEEIGVLILPFESIRDFTDLKEEFPRAIQLKLERRMAEESIKDVSFYYGKHEIPPENSIEALSTGIKYNADIVIWGKSWESLNEKNSSFEVSYILTNPNPELNQYNEYDSGILQCPTEQIFEGRITGDIDYIMEFLIGIYYFEKNNLGQTIRFLSNAKTLIDSSSKSLIDVYFFLAESYQNTGKLDSAIINYTRVLSLDSSFTRAITNIGYCYKLLGRDSLSNTFFLKSIRTNPDNSSALTARGAAYCNLKIFKNGVRDLEKAIRMNPLYPLAVLDLAFIQGKMGLLEKSTLNFNLAEKMASHFPLIYSYRAESYFDQGEYNLAIEYLDKLHKYYPNDISSFFLKARIYANQGQFQKAFAMLEEVKNRHNGMHNPFLFKDQLYRALIQFHSNNMDSVFLALERAEKINPYCQDIYALRIKAILKSGNNEGLLENIDIALKIDPFDSKIYSYRATYWYSIGNSKKALRDQKKAVQLDPYNGKFRSDLSSYYFAIGDMDNALINADSAILYAASFPEPFITRAAIHNHNRNYKYAVNDLRVALELSPEDSRIYYNLACTEALSKNFKKAMVSLELSFEKGILDWIPLHYVENDKELHGIRDLNEFKVLINKYSKLKRLN